MKPSGLYGRPIFGGKKPQFYFQVTVTLCNIHHRPFFRPQSMSTGAGLSNIFVFLFVFYVLNVADFSKKTLELQKKNKKTHLTPIFQNLDSLQTTSPLETVGKILQRGRSSCWTVYAANCTKKWHWGTQQCTLPLCVPQPHPTETETTAGSDGSGHLAQYQIRGVSPNAVDLRVFLAFGTVQTEETKIFFLSSKGFIIALMKSKSLQLQSNKSKRSSKNDENNTKKVLLFYVLYLFHGNVSGVVPLVAGWRETKLNCTIGLLGGKNFTLGFFPFFELYQRDYHCYSKNCYPCSLWRL